jgi:hypothetical protein
MIKLIDILLETLTEKKLCKKGRAYYDRRIAAGEKPSAYLSGRAVKVCKGLMEEEDLDEIGDSSVPALNFSNPINSDILVRYEFTTPSNIEYQVDLEEYSGPDFWQINFAAKKPDSPKFSTRVITNKGEVFMVMSTVMTIIKDFLGKNKQVTQMIAELDIFDTVASKQRGDLYAKYFKQTFPEAKIKQGQDSLVVDFRKKSSMKDKIKSFIKEEDVDESLRDWFKKEDWVRIDTQGNIAGPCGTMKKGKATTRCLPRAKANSLTKAERKATVAKKIAGGKKGKQFVPNTEKAKVKLRK